MRCDDDSSVRCNINPDKQRPQHEQDEPRSFSKEIENFDELSALIEEAARLMSLDENKAFIRHVLSVEICDLRRPQMTLVDLPELIHSINKSQSNADVELIKNTVP